MLRSPSTPHSARVRGVHRERPLGPSTPTLTLSPGPRSSPASVLSSWSLSESPEYPGPTLGAMSAPAVEELSVLIDAVVVTLVVVVVEGVDVCVVVVVVVVTGATLVSSVTAVDELVVTVCVEVVVVVANVSALASIPGVVVTEESVVGAWVSASES